jgi:hypothetical protein
VLVALLSVSSVVVVVVVMMMMMTAWFSFLSFSSIHYIAIQINAVYQTVAFHSQINAE